MLISKAKSLLILIIVTVLIIVAMLIVYLEILFAHSVVPVTGVMKEQINNDPKSVEQGRADELNCSNLADESAKEECVKTQQLEAAVNSLNVENCASFADTLKSRCLEYQKFLKAVNDKNQKYCSIISDKSENRNCFNQYYFTMALKMGDVSFCEKLSEKGDRTDCLDYLKQASAE